MRVKIMHMLDESCYSRLRNLLCLCDSCYIFMRANISNRNSHVGRHVLFSNDHPCSSSNISITWVTSLASLYNIYVLFHNIWHPLSIEQIPLIQIYQINHTLIKTLNFQLFHLPWKTLRLSTMIHSHNNYFLFFHTQIFCFLHLLKFCGLKVIAEHFDKRSNLKLVNDQYW